MSSDPFKITGPASIAFSGGRTSGMMLYRILEANGGVLPPNTNVVFCNTGIERQETLDFVERCSVEWSVPIVWVEYRYEGRHRPTLDVQERPRKMPGRHYFVQVDYATASRCGEPFEMLIRAKNMLPNVVSRFCTVEMKIRTALRYLVSLGWKQWVSCIGFRADEPQRVAKLRGSNRHKCEEPVAPLHAAGVTETDVRAFWRAMPFDLQLESYEGNCTLCFLKGQGKLERLMRERPKLADWWIRMETIIKGGRSGSGRFRNDRPSYAALLERSQRQSLPMMGDNDADELSISCTCSD